MTVLPFPDRNARPSDPLSSQLAGVNDSSKEVKRIAVLKAYARDVREGGTGLIDSEAVELAGYSRADDGVRRRCSQLRREGMIAQVIDSDGELVWRRDPVSKKLRMVCTITALGILELL